MFQQLENEKCPETDPYHHGYVSKQKIRINIENIIIYRIVDTRKEGEQSEIIDL
jgi:hypothetical protein